MGFQKYDAIYDKIRYLVTIRSCITYIIFHYSVKIKVGSKDSLPDRTVKEQFYAAKKPIQIWNLNVENIAVSKIIETKTNKIKFDKSIKPFLLIMPKVSRYVKTFKDVDKIKKLFTFRIDDEKLLEKYIAIWTKIEDLKNIELDSLPVYNGRYRKTKIRTYGNKVYMCEKMI